MNNQDFNEMFNNSSEGVLKRETLGSYTAKTFAWMAFGLLVTFVTAFSFSQSYSYFYFLYRHQYVLYILPLAEVILVLILGARLSRMRVTTARVLFFVYSFINGVTFATIFAVMDVSVIVYVFGLTALFFGILAVIGYFTKTDLSGWRKFLIIGTLFLLAFWVLSMFFPLQGMERIMCMIGLAIFMLYTAYDTQKIKTFYMEYGENEEMAAKTSIYCAFQLYLDFINMFLYILRLLGKRRN